MPRDNLKVPLELSGDSKCHTMRNGGSGEEEREREGGGWREKERERMMHGTLTSTENNFETHLLLIMTESW